MIGIADAMRDSPDMAGDLFAASLTRHAVDLPYKAGSTIGITERCASHPKGQVIRTQRHSNDATLTCLIYGRQQRTGGIADAMHDSPDMAGGIFALLICLISQVA